MSAHGMGKSAEWYVGAEHQELLAATRRQRQQREELKGPKATRDPGPRPASQDGRLKVQIPIHEVEGRIRDLLEDNFDDLYDAYTEIDMTDNGRVTKVEFKDGLRVLGASATLLPEGALDELFEAIDVNQQGFITLKDFLLAFQKPDCSKAGRDQAGGARALARKTGSVAVFEDREAKIKREFDEVQLPIVPRAFHERVLEHDWLMGTIFLVDFW